MARGTTLVRLLDLLRQETRRSLNPAHNVQMRDHDVLLLQRVQEGLWEDYTWPHLRVERFIRLQNGQRYYAPPGDVKIDRIEKLEVKYAGDWIQLTAGIDADAYSAWDSESDERSWPVERFRFAEGGQIEVWPVPSDNGDAVVTPPAVQSYEGWLKITGQRNLGILTADADTADLDDRLIVLFAAADVLAGQGAKDAQFKLAAAQRRLATLRGNLEAGKQWQLFNAPPPVGRTLRGPPRVHYRDRED